jgi:hypothetical protein
VGSGVGVEVGSRVDVGSGVGVEVGVGHRVDVASGSGQVTVLGSGGTVNPGTHALKIRAMSASNSRRRRTECKQLLVERVRNNILSTVILHISIVEHHNNLHSDSKVGTDVMIIARISVAFIRLLIHGYVIIPNLVECPLISAAHNFLKGGVAIAKRNRAFLS